MTAGYLVEMSEKTSIFYKEKPGDNFSPRKQVICSQEKLVWLLQCKISYAVWSATWIWVDQYKQSHPETHFEEWE